MKWLIALTEVQLSYFGSVRNLPKLLLFVKSSALHQKNQKLFKQNKGSREYLDR